MPMEAMPMTRSGHQRLAEELHKLKTIERPKVIQDIAEARSHGDLRENAEYHAAREKQGFIESRITILDDALARAQIVEIAGSSTDPEVVKFGAHVTLQDENTAEEKTYQIVGELEANIDENRISLSSPLARALLGKKIDDVVEVRVPKGVKQLAISTIRYG